MITIENIFRSLKAKGGTIPKWKAVQAVEIAIELAREDKIQGVLRYQNIKNQEMYQLLFRDVFDATNAGDGNYFVIYKNEISGKVYAREQSEFFTKFELIVEDKPKT